MHWRPTGLNSMGAHINIILGWGRKTVGASQCLGTVRKDRPQ